MRHDRYQSEKINRGASIAIRKGNELVTGEDEKHQVTYPILYFLTSGLSHLPMYWGPCIRAIQLDPKEIDTYQVGAIVAWFQYSSSKKGDSPDASFAPRNCYFHIHSLTGRRIQEFSNFPTEDEVLFLPHSVFLVLKKLHIDNKWHFYLRQVELGFGTFSVLWVDDHILDDQWENKGHMEKAASQRMNHNVHFIPKTNTESAIAFLKSPFGQRLKNEKNFRIMSDMTRNNEKPPHDAGARLLKQVRELGFNNKVMIFTSNAATGTKLVNDTCGKKAGDVTVTIAVSDMEKFVNFK